MTLAIVTFIGVLVIILGAYWAFIVRPEQVSQKLFERRMRPEMVIKHAALAAEEAEPHQGHRALAALQALIERSGIRVTLPVFASISGACAVVVALIAWRVSHWLPLTSVLACGGMLGPYFWVRRAAKKRMWKFEEQFPEVMELISRGLRAGHAFTTTLSMVAEEMPAPVGPEFKLLYDRQNFGLPLPEALKGLAERIPSVDTRFFVTAVLTQREAGGNLSGVLDNLAAVIRDRFNVKRQVRVVSAHGRMTGILPGSMPPVVMLLEMWVAPKNMALLFHDPLGTKLLMGAAALQVIGMFAIGRLSKVEY